MRSLNEIGVLREIAPHWMKGKKPICAGQKTVAVTGERLPHCAGVRGLKHGAKGNVERDCNCPQGSRSPRLRSLGRRKAFDQQQSHATISVRKSRRPCGRIALRSVNATSNTSQSDSNVTLEERSHSHQ